MSGLGNDAPPRPDADAIEAFTAHVTGTGYADLSPVAVRSVKTFLLDTLGVGAAGSAGPFSETLVQTQSADGGAGGPARVWVHGTRLPAAGAALCNAYRIHNSEFDCVHEGAVVHTMTALTAACLAHAERAGTVDGRTLITALVLGVDVACNLGIASRSALRFFRPGTAGAFAATAGVGKLMGMDPETLKNAFGAALSQLCGTMQAHTEGSIVLGLQVGYNARNAILACDMAELGLVAPHAVLEGPFGYFPLFEGDYDLGPALESLGQVWRITEVAHKPFPSGRATHGVLDAVLSLAREAALEVPGIEQVTARVPPLVAQLVGRPIQSVMTPNYARLCTAYCVARALPRGGLTVPDFAPEALADPDTLALGERVAIEIDGNPDPNALTPVSVTVRMRDGHELSKTLGIVYGHPERPMSREAQLEKLSGNWAAAARPLPDEARERLVETIDDLESCPDVGTLVDLLVPPCDAPPSARD